jgi:hypothetical protein
VAAERRARIALSVAGNDMRMNINDHGHRLGFLRTIAARTCGWISTVDDMILRLVP